MWNSAPLVLVLKDSPQGSDAQNWSPGSDVLLLLLVGASGCAYLHGSVPHHDGWLKSMVTDVYSQAFILF